MKTKMTKEEHKKRHVKLHKSFDELLADFLNHTKGTLGKTPIMELIDWSYSQTIEPIEDD